MAESQVIGTAVPRIDGADKVTGRASYTADVSLPGTLWGKALHSPYPHARILSLDTSAAEKLPGVHAVLTGKDVQAGVQAGMYGRAIKDIPVLALDRVRFFGERVAAVAADDEDIAQQALNLIEVEYEELPAVFDIESALDANAPVLHPEFASYRGGADVDIPPNGYNHASNERGDLGAGFTAADVIVENTYDTPRVHQGYLEPQSVLVSIDGEQVNVWTGSKAPFNTREALATAAGIEPESIIFNHVYIGGDFGGKATPHHLPIAYFLAKATRRPVRMVFDYIEEFMAGNPRHSTTIKLRTGMKQDGTITAHHSHFIVNAGAYAGYKPGRTIGGANQAAGPYRIENVKIESTHVYTNIVPGGHMRAPGYPQAAFALESHIDECARRLGIDPLDFRLKNLVVEGDQAASGQRVSNIRVSETLEAAAEAAGYKTPKRPNVGRGIAVGEHSPGGGQGTAEVTFRADGSVLLSTPIFEQGSGTYTTLQQVAAEELRLPLERIQVSVWNTDVIENDSGIGGSRGTRVATTVAHAAVEEAKAALLAAVAKSRGWPEDNLIVEGDVVRRLNTADSLSWPDFVAQAGEVSARSSIEERGGAGVTGYVAQVAEVEVDVETGEVKLLNFTTAHDVGRILNPVGHQGQINGGLIQGLGFALMEELTIESGRVTSLSFGDYKFPTISDIPALQTVLLESDAGVGPYQIRGIGENSIVPVAPAIANAIADAVGARVRSLPLTPEKVYTALKAR
jgi:CO/xanthine dehydrogenase Mo-binding subunit